jgi:hypothetical protein
MSQISDTRPTRFASVRTRSYKVFVISEGTLRHITGLAQLGLGMLNGLIGLRFILKLVAADPANPLVGSIYSITTPFLWVFQSLAHIPFFRNTDVELFSMIAILVYPLIGWLVMQLMWTLFHQPD